MTKNTPTVKIIVATHKKYEMPQDAMYLPLHVGAEGKTDQNGNPLDLGYQKDNTGENISNKNAGYYVGINPVSDLVGNTFGYLYEKNDLKLRKSVLCFLGVYERLFQSFEGSTIGYIEKNFNVKPELSKYEYENDKKAICGMKEWQEGALDFIKKISLRQDILVENKI